MQITEEQFQLLSKKEKKELKRKQRREALREFYRLRRIQKIVFWTILMIIIFGGLYILMALVGYASTIAAGFYKNIYRNIKELAYLFDMLMAKKVFV